MAMAAIGTDDMDRYLEILRSDTNELDILAKDLLINVTSFFRDPKVFDLLEEKIIPDLVRRQLLITPPHLDCWVQHGRRDLFLAMLFRERITAVKCNVKLQVFASDVDPDAVASAERASTGSHRGGRLTRAACPLLFEGGSRLQGTAELRAAVVFTVQDVLADPPFSRLDLVSCRNLLIYLLPKHRRKLSRFSISRCARAHSAYWRLGDSRRR